jgi:hypothetical protein
MAAVDHLRLQRKTERFKSLNRPFSDFRANLVISELGIRKDKHSRVFIGKTSLILDNNVSRKKH